jgi:tetratricopeptide (TPR) repeat protein
MKKICFVFVLLSVKGIAQDTTQTQIETLQRQVNEQHALLLIFIFVSTAVILTLAGFFMWKIRKLRKELHSEQIEKVEEKPIEAPIEISTATETIVHKKLADDLGGRPDGSPSASTKIPALSPKEALQKGKAAYDNGDYQKAISYLTDVTNLHPESFDLQSALYYRGLSKYRLGNYTDSIEDFNSANKIEEADYIYFIRGTAYFFLDKLPEALKDMDSALHLTPDYDSALEYRKDILEKMGRG